MTDKSNMIDILRTFPKMIADASSLGDDVTTPKEFVKQIAIAGMGGSGFSGDLLKTYLYDLEIPLYVFKDYTLPKYIQKKSLVFCVSYSGNTEETISAYRTAIRRGCKTITISSGGKLVELSEMNKTPHIMVPKNIPPRLSTPYLAVSILNVLSYSGLTNDQEKIIKKTSIELEKIKTSIEDQAKAMVEKTKDHVPVIYSSTRLFAIAEKWKTDINENAKTAAFYNVFPEFNHNEICSFENPKANLHVIIISDTDDEQKVKDRIKVFKKVMRPYKTQVTEIGLVGQQYLTRLFSAVWMGLFYSYYLALAYDTDPTPVKIIEDFKKELK